MYMHHTSVAHIRHLLATDELSRIIQVELNPYTTQIEPHDVIAEMFDALTRCITQCISCNESVNLQAQHRHD